MQHAATTVFLKGCAQRVQAFALSLPSAYGQDRARPPHRFSSRDHSRRVAPRGAWRVHGRQEGLCSLARFLLGRKPRLRRPASRADGVAANSPTRLDGCALLAVNAPPAGRPHAPLGIGAPAGVRLFDAGAPPPHPWAQPELSRARWSGCAAAYSHTPMFRCSRTTATRRHSCF
jgi:hypothetical protein